MTENGNEPTTQTIQPPSVGRIAVKDEDIVREYLRVRDSYAKLANRVEARCRSLGRDFALRGNYQSRAKDKDRLLGKLKRLRKDIQVHEHPDTPAAWLDRIGDLAGVRVLAYDEMSRRRFVQELSSEFEGPNDGKPVQEEKDKIDTNAAKFYRSTHLQVYWPKAECVGEDENLDELSCEIQVSSLLAHVWNEIEHDLVYKEMSGKPSETEKSLLRVLGNFSLAGDDVIAELMKATENRQRNENDAFTDEHDFVARLREPMKPADIGKGRIGQLFEVAVKLGLDNVKKIVSFTKKVKHDDIVAAISTYNASVPSYDDALKLDPTNSDYLAYLLAKEHGGAIIENFPTGRGMGAPLRIVRIAKKLQ